MAVEKLADQLSKELQFLTERATHLEESLAEKEIEIDQAHTKVHVYEMVKVCRKLCTGTVLICLWEYQYKRVLITLQIEDLQRQMHVTSDSNERLLSDAELLQGMNSPAPALAYHLDW